MGFAQVADFRHRLDRQMRAVMPGNVLQDILGLFNGFLRACPRQRLAFIIEKNVKHLIQLAFDCQWIGNRIIFADFVCFIDTGSKRRIPVQILCDNRGKISTAL